MLRKHAYRFGAQWDRYLSGELWAYRKPSFLMFGIDLRTPTEAALLPPNPLKPGDVEEYKEELVLSLLLAWELAAESIQRAQRKYNVLHDQKAVERAYSLGD